MKQFLLFLNFIILCSSHSFAKTSVPKATDNLISALISFSSFSSNPVSSKEAADNLYFKTLNFLCEPQMNYVNPNDFFYLGLTSNKSMAMQTWLKRWEKDALDGGKINSSIQIIANGKRKAPDLGKDEIIGTNTLIKKQIIYNGKNYSLWQRFFVADENGLITEIETTDKEIKVDDIIDKEKETLTKESYLLLAAQYYTTKNYTQAYKTYQDLIEKFPDCAEGWYRIAFLIQSNKGCKHSNPTDTAIEYMTTAYNLSKGELHDKAKRALFNWKNKNIF